MFKKQNYGSSEHADNAQLAVLCKITTEEEQDRGEVALVCHFLIHNSAVLYLLFFKTNLGQEAIPFHVFPTKY